MDASGGGVGGLEAVLVKYSVPLNSLASPELVAVLANTRRPAID